MKIKKKILFVFLSKNKFINQVNFKRSLVQKKSSSKAMKHFKFFALLLVGIFISPRAAAVSEGLKLYEIIPETREECDLLFELSKNEELYDFLSLSKIPKTPARLLVQAYENENFLNYLKKHKIEAVKILNENFEKTLELEFNKNRLLRNLKPYAGKGRLSTERYYTHDEINAYIEYLGKHFPKRVQLKQIGRSFFGRLLKTITITNGDGRPNKKVIFMDGGFHAREWISPAAVLYVIEQLVERFEENAELLKDYDWIIVPVVNPDGYEHTQTSFTARMWRKTRQPHNFLGQMCNGTDPNRNFGFHWNEEGASSNPCSDIYAGPHAFSEPETITVRDLMHTLTTSGRGKMYLTLHSYGNYLLYPWGWTEELPETWKDLDEVARAGGNAIFEATGTVYTVGSSTNVLYIAAGASDDYAFNAGFPISITMELPGGGIYGFNPPTSSIDRMVKETWIGIKAMAKKVIEKYH